MIILVNIALAVGLCAVISFIIAVIIYFKEKHELKKQDKSDDEYNQKMITMCLRSKKTGVCPGACAICAWNTRKKNGVVEFRKK